MLTLFTIPNPFKGPVEVIQRNAIPSWTLLRPACEIILFGDDEGKEKAYFWKISQLLRRFGSTQVE